MRIDGVVAQRVGRGESVGNRKTAGAGGGTAAVGNVRLQIGKRRLQGHDAGEVGVGVRGVIHPVAAAQDGLFRKAQCRSQPRRKRHTEGINKRVRKSAAARLRLRDAGKPSGRIGRNHGEVVVLLGVGREELVAHAIDAG